MTGGRERHMHCLVSGKVQGVFFRASTLEQAGRLHLQARAVNLVDGRVEVFASGDEQALLQLRDWLQHGPPMARVDDLQCELSQAPSP